MKKIKFLETILETKENFGKTINEQSAFNDAGEPLMTHSQFRNYSEPAEKEYDPQDDRPNNLNDVEPFSMYDSIEWKEVYEMLKGNTLQVTTHSMTDFTEELIPHVDMDALREGRLIYFSPQDNMPFFDVERSEIPSFEEFMIYVDETKEKYQNNTLYQTVDAQDNSESGYLRGREEMSEQAIKNIYKQFKSVINENINEEGFSDKIKTVFYEYVDATTRNDDGSIKDPEETIEKGQDMKELGQAVEELGKKAKEIQGSKTVPTTSTTTTITEYVEEEILPTVVEIIKNSENPRATKRELLEMFIVNEKK